MLNEFKVSACISTMDEYQNTWSTINSLLLNHGETIDEIVVCDSSPPGSEHQKLTAAHCSRLPKTVYIHRPGPTSAVLYKDMAVQEAKGDIILVCDCHVQFYPDSIRSAAEYLAREENAKNLCMGPCFNYTGNIMGTNQMLYEWEPYDVPGDANVWHGVVMRGGTYGVWVRDERGLSPDNPPFEIQQQGTGAMMFRKSAWTTPLSTFYGHGGTETWIMEKFRQNGGKVICHPKFRWVHQWGRPGMATFHKTHLMQAVAKIPDKSLQVELVRWINHHKKPSYSMSGKITQATQQKCWNTLAGAADLGRTDLYDAAVLEFTQGGKDGAPMWPKSCKEAMGRVPRPGMYEQLMEKWEQHGGNRSGAIPRELFRELERVVAQRPNARILEFGSGLSTILFDSLGANVTTIEHSQAWYEKLRVLVGRETTKLIHSPLEETASGMWYQWRAEPGQKFDVILVDGPPGGKNGPGRMAAKHFLADLMEEECIVFIDDTHREDEVELSADLERMYGFDSKRVVCV